jgi:hypothetical protein
MSLSNLILESRREEFIEKYGKKFTNGELKKILMTSSEIDKNNKFLDFLGRSISTGNVDTELDLAKDLLEKFKKNQENLSIKDINNIENIESLKGLIDGYSNRNRRGVKKLEGADEVYSDDRVTIVTPLNHDASCYYGAGTKWCTSSSSTGEHFRKYNDDGKLFYIINKKLPSDNKFYKIALLNKYDGHQSLFDAKDDLISGGWPGGSEQWTIYNSAIQKYLNDNYAEKIEIFKDKVKAQQELERINRDREFREREIKLQEMERRKANDLWGDNHNDMEAKEARAVFQIVNDYFTVGDDEDIYYLIPKGFEYYGLSVYEWLGDDGMGTTFAVGDSVEVRDAAKESLTQLISDNGVENIFNHDFIERFLDEDRLYNDYINSITDIIYDNPEDFLEDSDLKLSNDQENEIEDLKKKIEILKERQSKVNPEEKVWSNYQRSIEEFLILIERIESNPEGDDYKEDKIEEAVSNLEEEVRNDVYGYITSNFGYTIDDLLNYVDTESIVSEAIDTDGVGNTLSSYDGEEHESLQDGEWYFIYRLD